MNNKFLVCLMLVVSLGFAQKNVVKKSGVVRLSPRLLNYQGYLTDTLGNPITSSSLSLSFAIFDNPSGGSQKWTETQGSVNVDKGIFNVLLGSVTPIPDSVFLNSANRWLQLTVAGQVLSPRTPIVSTGYAFTSTYSDTAQYARTAAAGSVPQGYCILGSTSVPPAGYVYTGHYINSINQDEQWTTRANMPTARQYLTAAAVNGKIYALGGYNGAFLQTNEEYDPVANTWQTRANMPTGRIKFAAAVVNGKIYALGGANGGFLQTNEEYDPVANTWLSRADMPSPRIGLAAAAVNGKIYALGGDYYGFSNANEEYDPIPNTWQSRANMPTGRTELLASVVNNNIYALAGSDDWGTWLCTNEEYDPATNTWQTRTSIPTIRMGLAAASVNGKIYTVGGNNGSIFVATNEEYQPFVVPSPFYIYMKY